MSLELSWSLPQHQTKCSVKRCKGQHAVCHCQHYIHLFKTLLLLPEWLNENGFLLLLPLFFLPSLHKLVGYLSFCSLFSCPVKRARYFVSLSHIITSAFACLWFLDVLESAFASDKCCRLNLLKVWMQITNSFFLRPSIISLVRARTQTYNICKNSDGEWQC